jgi:YbbR domain-containing protein
VVDVEVPVTSPFKQMPLQVKLIGEPAPGYAVAAYTQNPELVTVYGPQDLLDKMDFFDGLQIDISGMKDTLKKTFDLPHKPNVLRVEPAKVEITVEITPSVTKTLDNIPVRMIGKNDGYTAKLAPDTTALKVTLEGAPGVLDALKSQDVQAVVDISNLAPGMHELPVTLNLPTFIKKPAQEFQAKVEVSPASGTKPSTTAKPVTGPLSGAGSPIPSANPEPAPTPGPSRGAGGSGAGASGGNGGTAPTTGVNP